MSKGRSTSTQTTTQIPVIPEYLQEAQDAAFSAAQGFQPQVYQGARFAPQNVYETQQIEGLGAFGGDMDRVGQYGGAISSILGGGIGSPDLLRQQYEADYGGGYLDQVISDRLADVTGDITSQYSRAGRLGSDAFGTALGRGIGSSIAPILAQQENIEAQRRAGLAAGITDAERMAAGLQLQAAGQIPQVQALDLQRLGALGAAGELERTMATRDIVAQQQAIAEQTAADQARLNALLAAAGAGTVGIGQTSTATSLEPPPSFASTLLGIGSIASGLGGQKGLLGLLTR